MSDNTLSKCSIYVVSKRATSFFYSNRGSRRVVFGHLGRNIPKDFYRTKIGALLSSREFSVALFSIDFEAPKDIFVVEIGSGVGEVAIYFGNHFPSDLSEELRAAQRQPSVSDPVIDAAVIGRAGDVTKNSF